MFSIVNVRPIWRTLFWERGGAHLSRATLRDIALVCVADSILAVSFGAIGVAGGLPLWFPIATSILVFAGGAQFAAVSVLLAGGGAAAAILAGLVLNSRLLPYGFAVADVTGRRWWTRLAGAHLTTDESVAFALREREDPARRHLAFWLCGIALFVSWNLATALGSLAGTLISDTNALGLDAAFPAVMLALVMPALRDRSTRHAAVAGAVIAVAATPFLPPGVPMLLALAGLAVTWRPARPRRPGWRLLGGSRDRRQGAPARDCPPDPASARRESTPTRARGLGTEHRLGRD